MNECKICPKEIKQKCETEYSAETQEEICVSHFCLWSWSGVKEFGKTIAQQPLSGLGDC
jgi:hypothetical protein